MEFGIAKQSEEEKVKKKTLKIILSIALIILIPLLATFAPFGMRNSTTTKLTLSDLFIIVNSANHNKGWVELTDKQIAGLTYTFVDTLLAEKDTKVKVGKVKAKIEGDSLELNLQAKIGILSGVITIEGKPYYEEGRVYYTIHKAKVGLIPVAIKSILNKFQKSEGNLKLEGTTISIGSTLDMMQIDGVKIENGKLYINVLSTLQKFNQIQSEAKKHKEDKAKEGLDALQTKIDELMAAATEKEKESLLALKDKVEKAKDKLQDKSEEGKKELANLVDDINKEASKNDTLKEELDKVIEDLGGKPNQSQGTNQGSTDKKEEPKKDYSGVPFYELPKEELEKRQREGMKLLRSNLYSLKGSVSDPDELYIVNLGIVTANSLITDLNYDFWGNVSMVRGVYDKLPGSQKEAFKNKIYTYIDMGNVFDLKEMFEY